MLAAYVAMDAPCAAVFDELLDADERFVIGPPAPDSAPAPGHDPMPETPPDDPDIEAKRARRRDADAKKKDAARKQRESREAAAAALRAARKKRAT
jgi:hypothetical protein